MKVALEVHPVVPRHSFKELEMAGIELGYKKVMIYNREVVLLPNFYLPKDLLTEDFIESPEGYLEEDDLQVLFAKSPGEVFVAGGYFGGCHRNCVESLVKEGRNLGLRGIEYHLILDYIHDFTKRPITQRDRLPSMKVYGDSLIKKGILVDEFMDGEQIGLRDEDAIASLNFWTKVEDYLRHGGVKG